MRQRHILYAWIITSIIGSFIFLFAEQARKCLTGVEADVMNTNLIGNVFMVSVTIFASALLSSPAAISLLVFWVVVRDSRLSKWQRYWYLLIGQLLLEIATFAAFLLGDVRENVTNFLVISVSYSLVGSLSLAWLAYPRLITDGVTRSDG